MVYNDKKICSHDRVDSVNSYRTSSLGAGCMLAADVYAGRKKGGTNQKHRPGSVEWRDCQTDELLPLHTRSAVAGPGQPADQGCKNPFAEHGSFEKD